MDWNASAPLRIEARNEIYKALDIVGNPSSVHFEGREAKKILETARDDLSEIVNVEAKNIIFTSGATEGASLVLHDRTIASSGVEHSCVSEWTICSLPTLRSGEVKVLDPSCSALQFANPETGIIQNLPKGMFFCDAVQGFGKIPYNFNKLGVEFSIVSAHKIGGPKGVGALLCKDIEVIQAAIKGGSQERGLRAGTENLSAIVGFVAAAKTSLSELNSGLWEEIRELRDYLEDEIISLSSKSHIIGKQSDRLPNTSNVMTAGWVADLQVIQLDLEGFAISAGSACSSGKVNKSQTLQTMGYSNEEANCAIRISIGPGIKKDDIKSFLYSWKKHYIRWNQDAA